MCPKQPLSLTQQREAGRRAGARLSPQISDRLQDFALDFELEVTSGPGHATTLARRAATRGREMVVAVIWGW